MSFDQLEHIYIAAARAFDESGEDDSVLSPFIQQADHYIETSGLELSIMDAQDLDREWFDISGIYWLSAYGNPQVGGTVEVPSDYRTRETRRVAERGLLTFRTDL